MSLTERASRPTSSLLLGVGISCSTSPWATRAAPSGERLDGPHDDRGDPVGEQAEEDHDHEIGQQGVPHQRAHGCVDDGARRLGDDVQPGALQRLGDREHRHAVVVREPAEATLARRRQSADRNRGRSAAAGPGESAARVIGQDEPSGTVVGPRFEQCPQRLQSVDRGQPHAALSARGAGDPAAHARPRVANHESARQAAAITAGSGGGQPGCHSGRDAARPRNHLAAVAHHGQPGEVRVGVEQLGE